MATKNLASATDIYEEAQKELELADKAYSEAYTIRKSNFQCTSGLGTVGIYGKYCKATPSQEERIKQFSRESSSHRAKWKRLMGKLIWDTAEKIYKLKGGQGNGNREKNITGLEGHHKGRGRLCREASLLTQHNQYCAGGYR